MDQRSGDLFIIEKVVKSYRAEGGCITSLRKKKEKLMLKGI